MNTKISSQIGIATTTNQFDAHALIVGIADYKHINGLPKTVIKDAQDIHTLLTDPSTCAYPKNNVELMLDEGATRNQIADALARLAGRCGSDSIALIYISSHGGRIPTGSDAGEYLLPVDTRLKPGVYPPEPDPVTAISGVQFTEALRTIKAQKLVVIFDCCHSGGIGQPKDPAEPIVKSGFSEEYLEKLATGRGRVILASSRDTEESWVLHGATNSLFTQHLLAGLRGGIASDDGLIRIFDLFEYVQPRVTSDEPKQHPIFKGELEENFPVALFLGGRKGAAPKDEQGYRYDAYISWVRAPEDTRWLRERILPALCAAQLNVAMTGQVDEPGIAWVVTVERAITQAKRTVILLSRAYLASQWADFENVMAQQLSVEQRRARLLPVVIDDALMDPERHLTEDVPLRLRQLTPLDLVDEFFGADNLANLPVILKRPTRRHGNPV